MLMNLLKTFLVPGGMEGMENHLSQRTINLSSYSLIFKLISRLMAQYRHTKLILLHLHF